MRYDTITLSYHFKTQIASACLTHRLWETLYMGSIPIVRHDVAINEFNDLPICFVNNWHEVTVEFLEKERVRIKNATHCMDKLKIGYWINKINEQLKNHHS